jgi:hypothetical protein
LDALINSQNAVFAKHPSIMRQSGNYCIASERKTRERQKRRSTNHRTAFKLAMTKVLLGSS